MKILVTGLGYRKAPLDLLERAAFGKGARVLRGEARGTDPAPVATAFAKRMIANGASVIPATSGGAA